MDCSVTDKETESQKDQTTDAWLVTQLVSGRAGAGIRPVRIKRLGSSSLKKKII